MPARKRGWAEIEPDEPLEEEPPQISPQLKKLRNTWEFANVYQYIAIFGNVIKVDGDLGIDVSLRNAPPLLRHCPHSRVLRYPLI